MGLLALGIVLILLGIVFSFTNLLGLAGIGDNLQWLGWVVLAIGVILAIVHFVTAGRRRDEVVVERRRGIL
jgi:protein-S-isoprenylcysteine O-methyltransferase Ste14